MLGDLTRRRMRWAGACVALLLTAIAIVSWSRLRERFVPDPTARVTPEDESLPEDDLPDRTQGVDLDYSTNRVVRAGATGRVRWATPLEGNLGLARPPHVQTDDTRAYVTHADGVTALDLSTGAVLWHSARPADQLLLSDALLFATGCSASEAAAKSGRWLTARDVTTGKELFRVALPAVDFEPLPTADAAGLVLVQDWDSFALLVDRTGRVVHQFDRQVVAAHLLAGGDRLILTNRDIVRLTGAGSIAWSSSHGRREWIAGGGFIPLPNGDVAAFIYGLIRDGGVQVVRLDPVTGVQRWVTACKGVGVSHSKYKHTARVSLVGDRLRVTSRGSSGTFVEVLNSMDGRSLGRDQR